LSQGQLNANGGLKLKSDDTRTALIQESGGNLNGDVTLQTYFNDNYSGTRFISSPFNGAQISDIQGIPLNLNNMYYYEETIPSDDYFEGWTNPVSSADLMRTGRGYALIVDNQSTNKTMEINGTPNFGSQTVGLKYTVHIRNPDLTHPSNTGAAEPNGWNLIGNMFCAPVSFIDLVNENPTSNIEKAYYVFKPDVNWKGQYYSYTTSGIASPAGAYELSDYIQSTQGFWVKLQNPGGFNSSNMTEFLTFNDNVKVTDPDLADAHFRKAQVDPLLRLEITSTTRACETVVYFEGQGSLNFDNGYDARYLRGQGPGLVELATYASDGLYSINAVGTLPTTSMVSVPLHHAVASNGSYSIAIKENINFPSGTKIYLDDKLLNSSHDLCISPYTFVSSQNDDNDRFTLRFVHGSVNVETIQNVEEIKMFKQHNNLVIELPNTYSEEMNVLIYNNLGQLSTANLLAPNQDFFTLDNLPLSVNNYYVVTIPELNYSTILKW
jgi:hypothetical protein